MNATQTKTFVACFLGWTLDAFDFFLVIVALPHIAADFTMSVAAFAVAVTATLAMRPVGALLFGWFADRYGRRVPLMVDIGLFSVIELATAFAPNFAVFLALRVLFGIAMGGEWGLGSALAMESLPPQRRGLFSGILQEGYAVGFLLAGQALAHLFPLIGWRGMFVVGALPALLILFIRSGVPESAVWTAAAARRNRFDGDALLAAFKKQWPLFLYGIALMAAFNFMSHGSQDPYPTFLTKQHGFSPRVAGNLTSVAALGAIAGGILFGWLSQRFGRRSAIVVAAVTAAAAVPLWAFSSTVATLALGGFAMQFAVQGAWGVIPAHLNEIAPGLARGTFPGLVYQAGNLIASGTLQIIAGLAVTRFALPGGGADYGRAMAVFMVCTLVAVVVATLAGRLFSDEKRHTALT